MVTITFEVGTGYAVADLRNRFGEAIESAIRKAMSRIYKWAKQIVPIDTGKLLRSLKVFATESGVRIEFSTRYAEWVNYGALPHMIVPQTRDGYLRFKDASGEWIFRKRVIHPGIKGDYFLEELGETARQILVEEIELALLTISLAHSRAQLQRVAP